MAYPIDRKLVIAVSSSALFDLSESHTVFREQGPKAYKQFQIDNLDKTLDKGVAFPFIRRFLNINNHFKDQSPVEVVLLSRNSAATGKRVFRSIAAYGLDITRAAFIEGKSPHPYIPAFNASLFLTANEDDVLKAIDSGYPAGTVLPSHVIDNESEELVIAFDFDGVIADDESEIVYKNSGLSAYHRYESDNSHIPHKPGLLADFFKKLSFMQKIEDKRVEEDSNYKRLIRTAIVTARNAPAHERVVTTLEEWGVSPNEIFFLGGIKKERVLSVLRPHIFIDDQRTHLESVAGDIPMVHVPFGIANETQQKG